MHLRLLAAFVATLALAACCPRADHASVADGCALQGEDMDIALAVVDAFRERRPLDRPAKGALTLARAEAIQETVSARLAETAGPAVGWKAGFVSPAMQRQFGIDAPIAGRLHAAMLLADGAEIALASGARLLVEGDLLVRVKDAGIHDATTPLELLRHLDAVIPFLEVPDPLFPKEHALDGPCMLAVNIGARFGVRGEAIPVQPTGDFLRALGDMTVVTATGDGVELGRARAADAAGNPCAVALWLVQEVARRGHRLRAGDLLSLGSFSKPTAPTAGMTVSATYGGLPGGPHRVSATFR